MSFNGSNDNIIVTGSLNRVVKSLVSDIADMEIQFKFVATSGTPNYQALKEASAVAAEQKNPGLM